MSLSIKHLASPNLSTLMVTRFPDIADFEVIHDHPKVKPVRFYPLGCDVPVMETPIVCRWWIGSRCFLHVLGPNIYRNQWNGQDIDYSHNFNVLVYYVAQSTECMRNPEDKDNVWWSILNKENL